MKFFAKKKYENKSYWVEEGKKYFTNYSKMDAPTVKRYDTQADLIIKFLSDLQFDSVCEAGCGFGRITKRIVEKFNIQKEKYLAFDVSQDQLNKARELVGDRVEFQQSSIEELDTARKYDLVLASEVLMHIPLENIESNLAKLASLSSKYVVNIDWRETDPKKSSFCCFAHDYKKIYEKMGLKTQVFELDRFANLENKINQTLYLAQK